MDIKNAVQALSALAQDSRLSVFRLLVEHGQGGLAAGRIAQALKVPHNTMSAHLTVLRQAGLIRVRRESRSMIYSADFDGIREVLDFLMRDCCKADPQCCTRLLDQALPQTTAHKGACE